MKESNEQKWRYRSPLSVNWKKQEYINDAKALVQRVAPVGISSEDDHM
jgi:hypothetical protein